MKKKAKVRKSIVIRVSKQASQLEGLRGDVQDLHNRIDDTKRDFELEVSRRVENAMHSAMTTVNQARAVVGEAKRCQHTMVQQIIQLIDERYQGAFQRLNELELRVKRLGG